MFNVDLRIDNELRPRIGIGRSLMLFPRFVVFGYYEYQLDAGWVNTLENNTSYGYSGKPRDVKIRSKYIKKKGD